AVACGPLGHPHDWGHARPASAQLAAAAVPVVAARPEPLQQMAEPRLLALRPGAFGAAHLPVLARAVDPRTEVLDLLLQREGERTLEGGVAGVSRDPAAHVGPAGDHEQQVARLEDGHTVALLEPDDLQPFGVQRLASPRMADMGLRQKRGTARLQPRPVQLLRGLAVVRDPGGSDHRVPCVLQVGRGDVTVGLDDEPPAAVRAGGGVDDLGRGPPGRGGAPAQYRHDRDLSRTQGHVQECRATRDVRWPQTDDAPGRVCDTGRTMSTTQPATVGSPSQKTPAKLVFAAPRRAKPPRHLADLTREERRAAVAELGEKPFRADQLSRHYFARLEDDPAKMTDLPAAVRERLVSELLPPLLTPVRELDCDGGTTLKTVWKAFDGVLFESGRMRYPDRATMCVSAQARCGMNCPFCATGQAGLTRSLSTAEIVEQVTAGARAMARGRIPGGPGRVSNLVFMGMGEPL